MSLSLHHTTRSYIKLNLDCNTVPHATFLEMKREIQRLQELCDAHQTRHPRGLSFHEVMSSQAVVDLLGGPNAIPLIVDRFYTCVRQECQTSTHRHVFPVCAPFSH